MVTVVALQDFVYQHEAVYAGQEIAMRPIDAAVAGRRGQVSLDPATKATYRRRDMTAEETRTAAHFDAPIQEPQPVKSPVRQRGRRRRVVA